MRRLSGPSPAGTQHQNDVVSASMRRDHVASTLIRRHFAVVCPLGRCPHILEDRFSHGAALLNHVRSKFSYEKYIPHTRERFLFAQTSLHLKVRYATSEQIGLAFCYKHMSPLCFLFLFFFFFFRDCLLVELNNKFRNYLVWAVPCKNVSSGI